MATEPLEKPLIVIVGPTASGKTTLAVEVAKRYDGEIICADSRTVYKDMDIGTAKPTLEEQQGIPHWGLSLVDPTERYNGAQFQQYAKEKINDIRARDRLPIVVGGTGLYIDGLIFDYEYPQPANKKQRMALEMMGTEDLQIYCIKNNIALPYNDKNKRHLVRAATHPDGIDRGNCTPNANTIIVGIATRNSELRQRIEQRTEHMFTNGVVEEATMLGKKYGCESEAMTSNVYRSLYPYLKSAYTINQTKQDFAIRDWQLAKRQMTWFRRNSYIEWCTRDEAMEYLSTSLETE